MQSRLEMDFFLFSRVWKTDYRKYFYDISVDSYIVSIYIAHVNISDNLFADFQYNQTYVTIDDIKPLELFTMYP